MKNSEQLSILYSYTTAERNITQSGSITDEETIVMTMS